MTTRTDAKPDCILSTYGVSGAFRTELEQLIRPGTFRLSLAELRQKSLLQMFRYLRSLNVDRVLLTIEDENGSVLLPVLTLLASIVPAREIYVVGTDLNLRRISWSSAASSMLKLVQASLKSRFSTWRARREIRVLLTLQRHAVGKVAVRHVLYLNANLWFGVKAGGSVGHISGVVNALLTSGYDVHFFSAGGPLLVCADAKFMPLQPPAHFGLPWELNYYRFHFDVVNQITRAAAHSRFKMIYQRMSIANYSGVVLSRLLNIPLVLEYNGSEAWVARNWGHGLREPELAEHVEEVNIRHADLIVTISDVLRDELIGRGVEPDRVVTYPNCIDPRVFDPARFTRDQIDNLRLRYGIAPDATVVTFVGTFGQWHGAEVLAEAIGRVRPGWADTSKLHFLLVGDGLKMPDVRAIISRHSVARVTFAGLVPQNEAPLYLAASDILCSPHVPNADGTRFFGSPTKLFEYMAMGKAIIASDLDQIGEVLSTSIRVGHLPAANDAPNAMSPAILCRPGNPDDIVEALAFLVDRPDWRQALGANARALALQAYTWEHHVGAIVDGLQRRGIVTGLES